MGLPEEGIQLATEALEQLGEMSEQAPCLTLFALSLCNDNQLDAVEEATSLAMDLILEKDDKFRSTNLIAFLARYTNPRARQRRPSTILR